MTFLFSVHTYDMKYHQNGRELLRNPASCQSVPQSVIQPMRKVLTYESGSRHSMDINVCKLQLQQKRGLAVMIRAFDDVGNPSEFSNMVTMGTPRIQSDDISLQINSLSSIHISLLLGLVLCVTLVLVIRIKV